MNGVKSFSRRRALLLVVPLLALMHGCASPPPEAILAGTWSLVPTNATIPALTTLLLTFDSNGNWTQVQYQIGSNATVTRSITTGDTTVNGSDVTISSSLGFGDTVSFAGTLDSTNTVITGNITTILNSSGQTITINNGPATMTKQ
jgi:hypothetical protein